MRLHPEVTDKQVKDTFNRLPKRLYEIHKGKYTYDNLQFKGVSYKGLITCPEHGDFEQMLHKHLIGRGCPKCALQKISNKHRKPREQLIKEFIKVHGSKYDYSKVTYINNKTPITIICQEHGEFYPTSKNHINGSGCPSCRKTGFDPSKPAILYYLSIENGRAYKIGITNLDVDKRFNNSDKSVIQIIKIYEYPIGKDAYDEEQRILKEFKEYKYTGPDLLKSGNTELFNKDILLLDDTKDY